jgi:hypothetical protein
LALPKEKAWQKERLVVGVGGKGYDATVAKRWEKLPGYDAPGRFRMSIRPKNGTFYDVNVENNTMMVQPSQPVTFGVEN